MISFLFILCFCLNLFSSLFFIFLFLPDFFFVFFFNCSFGIPLGNKRIFLLGTLSSFSSHSISGFVTASILLNLFSIIFPIVLSNIFAAISSHFFLCPG